MTSLLHGLPALINDVDIDNDLPSDCHLLGFDASDISHPLPGEKTGVFIFIQYVRIGRIFSRIREMLYTTTKRRNGAAKIQELDLDLRMWIQSLKSDGIHLEIGTPKLPEVSQKQSEQTTIWLQLLANFAMILIHRPGLSFDDNTPEFANCLRACVASSSANLAILECSSIPRWLQNLSMNGPGTIFQSALMQAFSQCQAPTITSQICQPLEGSLNSVSKGVAILERYIVGNISTNDSNQSVHNQSLAEVIGVLNLLHSLLSWKRPTLANTEPEIDQGVLDQTSLFFGMPTWSTDGLDVLNYVTATDWAYEIPGPFMGYPDLGVAEDNIENT